MLQVLIAFDQLANTLIGGHADETLSARAHRMRVKGQPYWGWLARAIANAEVASADVDLMLFLPTGYSGANKIRTEANGYAALMELEAAMRGNKEFISQWDSYDNLVLDREPYKEVFSLRVFGELSFSDISDLFGKSESWARVTYHRACKKIREELDDEDHL